MNGTATALNVYPEAPGRIVQDIKTQEKRFANCFGDSKPFPQSGWYAVYDLPLQGGYYVGPFPTKAAAEECKDCQLGNGTFRRVTEMISGQPRTP
jgi:hypothetical protein